MALKDFMLAMSAKLTRGRAIESFSHMDSLSNATPEPLEHIIKTHFLVDHHPS